MGRALHKLTATKVAKLTASGLHLDGGGLYLRVGTTGGKSWVFRYSRRDMGLGSFPAVSLASARQAAAAAREQLARGEDPIEARKRLGTVTKGMSFDQAAERYIGAHESAWRSPRTADQWRSSLVAYASPVIGRFPVAAVGTHHILDILEPIWREKSVTAAEVRGRLECILDWAKVHNLRDGENPARWRGNLKHLLPAISKVHRVRHHAALPYAALPAFMTELRANTSLSARVLELMILTAARRGEALGASWAEIDLDTAIWEIPPKRMKASILHRVPLSAAAVALLADLPRIQGNDFLFPGRTGRPLAETAVRELLKRMSRTDITGHGFRSTFRDWVAEQTNFQRELAEVALAHSVGSETERAYQRGDLFAKRRELMDAWTDYINAPLPTAKQLTQVPIGALS
jgi:integrase